MRIYKAGEASWIEPPGHFGHLAVSDVLRRDGKVAWSVQLSRCPPGGGGELHHHPDQVQLFFIISGALTFQTDNGNFTLRACEGVVFEPGERHATLNDSQEESLSILVTVQV